MSALRLVGTVAGYSVLGLVVLWGVAMAAFLIVISTVGVLRVTFGVDLFGLATYFEEVL